MNREPKVSLIICSYNQEAYIREALQGAFVQTRSPTEIIVSDDCSTDKTFQIIQEMVAEYVGDSTLIVNRNEKNMGLADHVNKVFSMASGDLIIGSAGDDISLPNRVEVLARLYGKRAGKPTLFHGPVLKMGPKGEGFGVMSPRWGVDDIDISDTALKEALYIGASSTFTRELLNCFPPIKYKNAYEDLVWGFRAALVDGLVCLDQPMVKYRVGVGMSWNPQAGEETPQEKMRRKQRRLLMLKDVFSQRILDLDHVEDRPEYKRVRRLLKRKLLKVEIYLSLLEPSRLTVKYFISNPVLLLGRYWALTKFRRRHSKGLSDGEVS